MRCQARAEKRDVPFPVERMNVRTVVSWLPRWSNYFENGGYVDTRATDVRAYVRTDKRTNERASKQVTHALAGCRVSLATTRGSLANQLVDTRDSVCPRIHLSKFAVSPSSLREPITTFSSLSLSFSFAFPSLSLSPSLSLPFSYAYLCMSLLLFLISFLTDFVTVTEKPNASRALRSGIIVSFCSPRKLRSDRLNERADTSGTLRSPSESRQALQHAVYRGKRIHYVRVYDGGDEHRPGVAAAASSCAF